MTVTFHKPAQQQIDLEAAPDEILAALGKERDLVPYGGGNFGMPIATMEPEGELIVPTERFFMRSNGPVPIIDPELWRLRLTGAVRSEIALSLDDLQRMAQRTITAVLECAGNGRTRYEPLPEGTPWRHDAAGNAVWSGVPLADVLDRAGVRDGVVDVVAQGGDFPEMRRGLPLAVARDPGTLLVLRMNSEPLTVAHGGPVRLLVPGWAGIASTKWLVALELIDHAFAGFWNSDNYVYWSADGTPLRPVTEMPVKSIIGAPAMDAVLSPGRVEIAGYAWSGQGAITLVEISLDGGTTWRPSPLRSGGRRSWTRFRYDWQASPGSYRLLARATDERGLRQPVTTAWNAKGYAQNGIHAIDVTVQPSTKGWAPSEGKE